MIEKFTINCSSNILDAMKRIDSNKENFLICVDKNQFVCGTITDGDIRRHIIESKSIEACVSDVMSTVFDYLDITNTFTDIAQKFKSSKINFLPIIKDEKLQNVLTKKQFHIMLLEDIKIDLLKDNSVYDGRIIEHEIYNKPWGFYKSTMYTKMAQSKIITVFADEELSLQKHKKREEHWIIIKGEGKVILGDSEIYVKEGRHVYIPKDVKHQIINLSKDESLIFAEVQLGTYFGEDDIIRYKDKYNRC